MTENIEVQEDLIDEGPNPMLEMVHKLLLAGIGAVAMTQEEVEKIVHRLVERGEIAEQDGRKLVKDVMARRKKKTEEVRTESVGVLVQRMEDVLARMNMPSKSDIDALNRKITVLTEKVDALAQEQE